MKSLPYQVLLAYAARTVTTSPAATVTHTTSFSAHCSAVDLFLKS